MIRRIIFILILALAITGCGAPATMAPATQAPATEAPLNAATEAPTEAPATEVPTEAPGLLAVETSTPAVPTDIPLPTLALPSEAANAPAQMVWDGVPTYLGESAPGYSFRVTYDPALWALTTDQFGFPALAHRQIPACVISVTSGRGLPGTMSAEHDILSLADIKFDVGKVSENGVLKFVTYTGGDGKIITGFEVSFEELPDECLLDAETVLSTLQSIPVAQATPQP
ncbi:MAG TPA: hypothetical protein VHP14_17165 [Anaerolineales bacterium]|nr:hypothetical protein [Anaerolineales bacterium]